MTDPRFAFLVHPLVGWHRRLVGVRRGHARLAIAGEAGIEAVGAAGQIALPTATGYVPGLILTVPDTATQLVADQGRALALQERAGREAVAAGVVAIGLGNALAVVAGRGALLAERLPVPVTTGHAATSWATTQVTLQVLDGARGPVGVLGFKSTVGDAIARMLLATGCEVWVDATGAAAERRAAQIGARFAPMTEVVGRCRVLVGAATTGPMLHPAALRVGTTLIDLALPPTLYPGRLPGEVRVVAGEPLRAPDRVRTDGWGRLWLTVANYGRGCVYACLAEPLALTLTAERGFSEGRRLDLERVEAMGTLLTRNGYVPVVRPR